MLRCPRSLVDTKSWVTQKPKQAKHHVANTSGNRHQFSGNDRFTHNWLLSLTTNLRIYCPLRSNNFFWMLLKSGEITWRCWWDGLDGPIRNSWNCQGVPAIILLDDQRVIQDVMLDRWMSQEDFEKEITKLLSKKSQE